MEQYLVMPITIIRNVVFEEYVLIPAANGCIGQDLTGYTLKAELRDKPGGTLLATFTCTPDTPPPGIYDTQGWVQIRLDDTTVIPTGYYRGTWSLLTSNGADNPVVTAAGPAEIISQGTSW